MRHDAPEPPIYVTLTPAERAVVCRLAEGKRVRVVAKELGLSRRTVESHIQHVARRIPGDLPPVARIIVWHRGGSRLVLGAL